MKYFIDLHTHTIASGHAYSTLMENAREAYKNGIKILGVSDHGPKMPGGPHIFYFGNIKAIPREIEGVKILRGCEANILNIQGELDIPHDIQGNLDYIIASLHDVCFCPANIDENTKTLLNVMENSKVDILGHIGNPAFPIHVEDVVKKAKDRNVIIEINNSSLSGTRIGSEINCEKIAKACKDYGVRVILGSDSHIAYNVGKFSKAEAMLKAIDIPEELVINTSHNEIINYLKNKGKLLDFKLD